MRRSLECAAWLALLSLGACAPRSAPCLIDASHAAPDATVDAADDGRCTSNSDCPTGVRCVDGECRGPGAACTGAFDCPAGLYCVDGRCGEPPMPMADNCCEGAICEGGLACGPECTCIDASVCDPPCTDPLICDFGYCTHPCFLEGCTEPELCTDTGCQAPLCTREECLAKTPPEACDPYDLGCYDPCDDPAIAMGCADLGGTCELGSCVDTSCMAVSGTCGFVTDCCGVFYCQSDTDPAPPCPGSCTDPETAPADTLCACGVDGYCVDLRWSF